MYRFEDWEEYPDWLLQISLGLYGRLRTECSRRYTGSMYRIEHPLQIESSTKKRCIDQKSLYVKTVLFCAIGSARRLLTREYSSDKTYALSVLIKVISTYYCG